VEAVDLAGNIAPSGPLRATWPENYPAAPVVRALCAAIEFSDGPPILPESVEWFSDYQCQRLADWVSECSYGLTTLEAQPGGTHRLTKPHAEFFERQREDGAWLSVKPGAMAALIAECDRVVSQQPEAAGAQLRIYYLQGVVYGSFGGGDVILTGEANGGQLYRLAHEYCHWGGSYGHATVWVPPASATTLVGPSYQNPAAGGWTWNAYESALDPQGTSVGHPSAPHKRLLGWLRPDQVAYAASGVFEIAPLELPGGLKEVRIALDSQGYYYSLEYRRDYGWDGKHLPPEIQRPTPLPPGGDGVVVSLVLAFGWTPDPGINFSADVGNVNRGIAYAPGGVFHDTLRGVRVEVLDVTPERARVRIG
jgi:hypothetical protein